MVVRLVLQTVVWVAFMAALLFLPAGRLDWSPGWVFLALMGGGGLILGLWLAKHDPALLKERLSPVVQKEQKRWDSLLMVAIGVLWCLWMTGMAVDAARLHLSHMPVWTQPIGALGIAVSLYLGYRTFRENSFAAPVVKIQSERGQTVISSGPYAHVRHPMYAGALFFFIGTPLLLGSWYGLALAPLLTVILAVRVVMEERTLRSELAGYADYASRVRYRLIPLIW